MSFKDTSAVHFSLSDSIFTSFSHYCISLDLYFLQGMALIDRNCKPEVIRYFHVNNLPEEIAER